MATTVRHYPIGFVGTEEAILRLAKARHPERWGPGSMSDAERGVWAGINHTFNGYVLDPKLRLSTPEDEYAAAWTRLRDFDEGMVTLRRALHAGSVIAQFCDEEAKFDTIQSEGWGIDDAPNIFLTGLVDLDYGERTCTRLVLIPESAVEALEAAASLAGRRERGEQAGEEDPFDLPKWNLDQALIWMASRDREWTWEAQQPLNGFDWNAFCLSAALGDASPTVNRKSAERSLMLHILSGRLSITEDGETIDRRLLDGAYFSTDGGKGLHLRRKDTAPSTTNVFPDGSMHRRYDIIGWHPRLDPQQVRNLVDPPKSRSKQRKSAASLTSTTPLRSVANCARMESAAFPPRKRWGRQRFG
jgi:hypothetical protein